MACLSTFLWIESSFHHWGQIWEGGLYYCTYVCIKMCIIKVMIYIRTDLLQSYKCILSYELWKGRQLCSALVFPLPILVVSWNESFLTILEHFHWNFLCHSLCYLVRRFVYYSLMSNWHSSGHGWISVHGRVGPCVS